MNAKLERVKRDIDKTKEKISEAQARLKELERQKTELENTEIVDVVRGLNISITDLAELLKGTRATSGQNVQKSDPGPEPEPADAAHTEEEETEE
ncbi:MAG: DUF4315 family protein [Clostridiales bacterium]|nr:DUF4315 family protein [Clostridiales bacterium]